VFFDWIDGVVHVVGIAEERESNIAIIGSGFVAELPSFGCGWKFDMGVSGTDPRLRLVVGHLEQRRQCAKRAGRWHTGKEGWTRDEQSSQPTDDRYSVRSITVSTPVNDDARCSQVTQVVARLAQRMLRSLRVLDIRSITMRYESDLSKFAEKPTWV
jgi:hypothetical protein